MNLLLNQNEIVQSLVRHILMKQLIAIKITWNSIDAYIDRCQQQYQSTGLIEIDFREVNALISRDITLWQQRIMKYYKQNYKPIVAWINSDPLILDRFSNEELINMCVKDGKLAFAKGLGQQLTNSPNWIVKQQDLDLAKPLLIRNTVNNEKVLQEWMQCNREFWFVDSGYTNFLIEKHKLWHRLVKNHIHHNLHDKSFPCDRLHLLSCFPEPWRKPGKKILVIESSPYHYLIKGTTLDHWKENIKSEIEKYTNRPIEFRPKNLDRKTRESVYESLKNSKDYYCVISDSSAAAIEAIWCGIPAITLDQHITNTVSRKHISQINDLYYGSLGDWLCALTYSQWTFEELMSGTALKMLRRYSHV
jgi:hypothetical protein